MGEHLSVPNVSGEGLMAPGLPGLTMLAVPMTLETLRIVWPTALSVAFVGLLETPLTAKLVDELSDTRSDKGRESWAFGVANIAAGFYGGIAGCAMIGQTVVNVKIGGSQTRLSTAAAALALLVLVTVLSNLMAQIPMVALAAVMMIVAIKTFDWRSISPATLRRMPVPETLVMAATMLVTVVTGNLAFGIAGGVLLVMVLFVRRVAHVIRVERVPDEGEAVRYAVYGPLFFGSGHASPSSSPTSATPNTSGSISRLPRSGTLRRWRPWIPSRRNIVLSGKPQRSRDSISAAPHSASG